MIDNSLQILDNSESVIKTIYEYNFSAELMGKESLTIEIDLPIYYNESGVEVNYPFSTDWHIFYNNDIYYLNNEYPSGVKNNEKRTIHYTLVFESRRNRLDSIYARDYGKVYTDNDNDGYADDTEVVSDIILGTSTGFYGNLYDFMLYLRKILEYTFEYITDSEGNKIKVYDINNVLKIVPKYTAVLGKIDYGTSIINDELKNIEVADYQSSSPKYAVSDKSNIDTTDDTILGILNKMNTTFTYKETINGIEKEIGYAWGFKTKEITDSEDNNYTQYVVVVDLQSETIKDNQGTNVVFEYGGSKKGGGLLSITRTNNENKTPTRVYGKGGSENLPTNYFHIFEDRSDEISELEGKKITSLTQLRDYFNNTGKQPDKTKRYLVPTDNNENVYDKYFYADVAPQIASVDYITDSGSGLTVSTSTILIVSSINTTTNTYTIDSKEYTVVENYVYLVSGTKDNVSVYLAYWYNPETKSTINIGVWSKTDNTNLDKGIPNTSIVSSFVGNKGATTQEIEDSNIVLVNGADNIPKTLDESKVYYIIYTVSDGTISYQGIFQYGKAFVGWYTDTTTTYERVNPFPKYITYLNALMPICFREYITGWYYGYLWKKYNCKLNKTTNKYTAGISILGEFTVVNKDNVDTSKLLYTVAIDKQFGNTIGYMYIENSKYWEAIGYIEDGFTETTKTKGNFYKGLSDFCEGCTYLTETKDYDYTTCGHIWHPTDYYTKDELVKKYGLIETKQTFDIKPSLVEQYVKSLGRVDEIVDVYIPNADDNNTIGKYWKDPNVNSEDFPLKDLPLPETEVSKTITISQLPQKAFPKSSGEVEFSTENINFSAFVNKYMILSMKSDIPSLHERIGEGKSNEIIQTTPNIPLSYIGTEVCNYIVKDENQETILSTKTDGDHAYEIKESVYIGVEFANDTEKLRYSKLENLISTNGTALIKIYVDNGTKVKDIPAYIVSINATNIEGKTGVMFIPSSISTFNDLRNYAKSSACAKDFFNCTTWKKATYTTGIYQSTKGCYTITEFSIAEEDEDKTYSINFIRTTEKDSYGVSKEFQTDTGNKKYTIRLYPQIVNVSNIKIHPLFSDVFNVDKDNIDSSKTNIYLGVLDTLSIECVFKDNFDKTTREFFIWVKNIGFNPTQPAWQGESYPSFVFTSGDLTGIDNKFALSDAHANAVVRDDSKSIQTNITEGSTVKTTVDSYYRVALSFIENNSADNKSIFMSLPQKNIKPKQGDLFIIENVVYPHNPYAYSAEKKVYEEMKKLLDIDALHTYSIVFDDIVRTEKGIDFNQLKTGNKLTIKNRSLINNKYSNYVFSIKQVSISKGADSLYDKYSITLQNYRGNIKKFVSGNPTITPSTLNKELNNNQYKAITSSITNAAIDTITKKTATTAKSLSQTEKKLNDVLNKSWSMLPYSPYYKGDTWLVTEDTTIDGVTFKKGVTYLCKSTRLEGTFTTSDWSPMSLYKYNDLDTLPSINDTTLKGNVYLATKEQIDTTNSNVLINKNDIRAIREEIKNLLYSKTYDFTDKTIEEDTDLRLEGNASWVFEDGNEKIITEREGDALVVAVPRESTYTVTIDIAKYEGALVVKAYDNNTSGADYTEYVYKDEPLVITYKSVSSVKVVFSTVTWLNSIVVTDIKMPSVPTKFSQLTNDLDLVNCTINETEGSIDFNIG